jgi:hypothetical protein
MFNWETKQIDFLFLFLRWPICGRTLQYLGPIFGNGTYDIVFSYNYNLGNTKTSSTTLTLDRSCR